MTSPRHTKKPCPCGSGLPGKRDLSLEGYARVFCERCMVPIEHSRVYREYQNDDAKRQARARRALEELREIREIERAGG